MLPAKFLSGLVLFLMGVSPALSAQNISTKEVQFLQSATKVTIRQIYAPEVIFEPKRKNGAPDDRVIKSVDVSGPDCTKVVKSLINGINSGAPAAACFDPHHELVIQSGRKQKIYTICFDCHWVYSYSSDGKEERRTIPGSGRAVLDAYLKPIAFVPKNTWPAYQKNLDKRLNRSWILPKKQSSKTVTVRFDIKENGELSDLKVFQSSGSKTFDGAAIEAVKQATPFSPLDPAWEAPLHVERIFGREPDKSQFRITD